MKRKLLWMVSLALCVLALSVTALAASPEAGTAGEGSGDVSAYVIHLGGFPQAVEEGSDIKGDPLAAVKSAIYSGMAARVTSMDLSAYWITPAQLETAYSEVLNAHPELFYLTGYYYYYYNGYGYVTTLIPYYDANYGPAASAAFESACSRIVGMVDPSWSELERVLFFHDYIATHCEYDLSYSRYNAYDVLVTGSAVCQGYAEAFQALCLRIGINCDVVSSRAIDHAWNLVMVHGETFFVDCTWDDPSNYWYEGRCEHDNFLLSASALAQNHRSTDWVIGRRNIYYSSGASSRYDNAFWRSVNTAIPLIGHVGAYVLSNDLDHIYLYNFSNGSARTLSLPEKAKWYVWGSGSWYTSNFCSVAAKDGRFYFTLPQGICSLTTAGAIRQVYEMSASERSQGYIYGIVSDAGTLYYNIGTQGWETRFTRREFRVKNGLDFDGQTWHYYVDGRIDTSYTGLAYREDIGWWYVKNGTVDFDFTGLAEGEGVGWWYCVNGTIDFGYTGPAYDARYGWAWVEGGAFRNMYTGLVYSAGRGWIYVKNGSYDSSYTGLAYREDIGWWYVKNGNIKFDYTGFAYREDIGWWYVRNGRIDFDYTGFAEAGNGTFYVEGGAFMGSYTGLAYDEAVGWRYVKNGMVDTSYTGLAYREGVGWWYCRSGAIDFGYTGIGYAEGAGYWYCRNGTIDFGFTGLYRDTRLGWVYVAGGAMQSDYTGLVYDDNLGWRYVNSGRIDESYTGLVYREDIGWWYVRNGAIDFGYTGLANRADIGWWYVENGNITFTYNGIVVGRGHTWSVVNSRATQIA